MFLKLKTFLNYKFPYLTFEWFQNKYNSSRIIPSIFFVLFVTSFISFSSSKSVASFLIRDLITFPCLFWSVLEIFKLFPRLKSKYISVFLICILFYVPEIFLICIYEDPKTEDLKKYLALYLLISFFIFVISSFIFGAVQIFEINRIASKLVFRRLILFAFLFWNSLFFVSLCGKIDWVISSFVLVSLSDAIAYLVGSKIGRIKIFKSSPNKTLEGFLVPLIFFPFIFMAVHFGFNFLDDPKLSYGVFAFPLLVIFFGFLGDLFFSSQKRILKIKDYGYLFGGQGGFWDRLDSHSFSLIFCFLLLFLIKCFSSNASA